MDGRTKEYRARLENDLDTFRAMFSLRGLADYIFTVFSPRDQDEIVNCLQDPTLQSHVDLRILFTKKVGDGLTSNDPNVMDTVESKEGPSPEYGDYWIV